MRVLTCYNNAMYPGIAKLVSRLVWENTTRMNDPTQFEQVDETCGLSRVILCLKSLGMSALFEIITPKRI